MLRFLLFLAATLSLPFVLPLLAPEVEPEPIPTYSWSGNPNDLFVYTLPALNFPRAKVRALGDELRADWGDSSWLTIHVHDGGDGKKKARERFESRIRALTDEGVSVESGDDVATYHRTEPTERHGRLGLVDHAVVESNAQTPNSRDHYFRDVPYLVENDVPEVAAASTEPKPRDAGWYGRFAGYVVLMILMALVIARASPEGTAPSPAAPDGSSHS